MTEYWESRFKEEGAMWKFEPSDSAFIALELFKEHKIKHVLIPGFGYGRNARVFYDNGFTISGIEISRSAIELAVKSGLKCRIHHGSVTKMPFDNQMFDGIFCYALIHLLNKKERRNFMNSCLNQLKSGGIMIFTVVSKKSEMYGKGKQLSKDRFEIKRGLNVFFYDSDSAKKEFAEYGMVELREIEEPIKYITGQEPLKCILVICMKK
jgi:SAM-dependent methyltransferase